jgi:hypothetical protein
MTWYSIRLELARAPDFPGGSPSRCYLLRLPLSGEGRIEDEAIAAEPGRATVRRFWPNEPDLHGHLVRTGNGWALSFRADDEQDGNVFRLEADALRIGNQIMLTEPCGLRLPFKVAAVTSLNGHAAH